MRHAFDEASVKGAIPRDLRMLVVDEESDHYECLVSGIGVVDLAGGAECRLASGEVEALRVIDEWNPHVVLVDVHCGGNGLRMIEGLAARGAQVVALSQERIPDLERGVLHYGARCYHAKSDDPEAIEAFLSSIFSLLSESPASH